MAMRPTKKLASLLKALTVRKLDFEYSGMPCTLERVTGKKLLTLIHSQMNCSRHKPGRPWYPMQ
ncbi:MAG TPA: hypothetical protein VGK34_05645, partial [Armatimonadota bacterium]